MFSYAYRLNNANSPKWPFISLALADPAGDHTLVRNSRRRKKKLELVQQAAEEELAEINLEQQMLRELNLKPKSRGQPAPARPSPVIQSRAGPGKTVSPQPGILKVPAQNQSTKKKSGISLDLSAMIDALEVRYIYTFSMDPMVMKSIYRVYT